MSDKLKHLEQNSIYIKIIPIKVLIEIEVEIKKQKEQISLILLDNE